jgi:hypothetical protein
MFLTKFDYPYNSSFTFAKNCNACKGVILSTSACDKILCTFSYFSCISAIFSEICPLSDEIISNKGIFGIGEGLVLFGWVQDPSLRDRLVPRSCSNPFNNSLAFPKIASGMPAIFATSIP